ncbi:MAG: HAD hydrolase family protein [Gemmatimonadota bacterium]|nr:HAD hydrolase family protein [Gemmatimonadota bacterium]
MNLTPQHTVLIATDIDGTLLDENARLPVSVAAWRAAVHTFAGHVAGCTVAFASSRTLDELVVLQRALGVTGPCIAEDGAVLALDAGTAAGHDIVPYPHHDERRHGRRHLRVWREARSAADLRNLMADVDDVRRADASYLAAQALRLLGINTPGAARRAVRARHHSVLLDATALSGDRIAAIKQIAAARGLQLRRGGRWLTLAATEGKGAALRALRRLSATDGVPPVVVAIGNEENDVSLLQQADFAFVIRNPGRGPHPALVAIPRAIVLDTEGPGGWTEMLHRLIGLRS